MALSYFHSISAASYFVDPIFSKESVVPPLCQRKSPGLVCTVLRGFPDSLMEIMPCDIEILSQGKVRERMPVACLGSMDTR